MDKVLHVSSECYPAAKVGGMGDVVGALPIYLPKFDIEASVVIPKYKTPWINNQQFENVYQGTFVIADQKQIFSVEKIKNDPISFPLYCIDLPGLFDRPSIYLAENGRGFEDESKRNIAFQTAVVEWLSGSNEIFKLIHVHDHMTGLIPFFMQHSQKYKKLKNIPSVLTIHNSSYTGAYEWNKVRSLLPNYDSIKEGLLDWDNKLNSLASAIKCVWSVATVSPAYMKELINNAGTLRTLYLSEKDKCSGILNGIDNNLWNPSTDTNIINSFDGNWKSFKSTNKAYLQHRFKILKQRPILSFIGRLAHQKGVDLMIKAIRSCLKNKMKFDVIILGSGNKAIEDEVKSLAATFHKNVGNFIGYDEGLARQIYAGSDFLMMPSRFEPCGLNQLYSMRYGTIPITSNKGGLKDTVADISKAGQGIVIEKLNTHQIIIAIERALSLYKDKKAISRMIQSNRGLNYSWENSSSTYAKLYSNHIKN